VRIVADENVADAVVNAVHSAGHDLELVRDTYGTGTDDTEIESRASEDHRAILTYDGDSSDWTHRTHPSCSCPRNRHR